jgi:hypothetical protein
MAKRPDNTEQWDVAISHRPQHSGPFAAGPRLLDLRSHPYAQHMQALVTAIGDDPGVRNALELRCSVRHVRHGAYVHGDAEVHLFTRRTTSGAWQYDAASSFVGTQGDIPEGDQS